MPGCDQIKLSEINILFMSLDNIFWALELEITFGCTDSKVSLSVCAHVKSTEKLQK